VRHLRTGFLLQHHADQVRQGAVAGRGVGHAARLSLAAPDQFVEVLERRVGRHHDRERRCVDLRHRHEVFQRIEARRRVERGVHRHQRDLCGQQGVAVGARVGGRLGPDVAPGAASVLHQRRLAGHLGQARGDEAGGGIVAAAGRERRDEPDRLGRKAVARGEHFGERGGCAHREGAREGGEGGEPAQGRRHGKGAGQGSKGHHELR
jgi:hypothetical protein